MTEQSPLGRAAIGESPKTLGAAVTPQRGVHSAHVSRSAELTARPPLLLGVYAGPVEHADLSVTGHPHTFPAADGMLVAEG